MQLRTLAIASILLIVGMFVVVAFVINRDDHTRNEALLFLDRYQGLDVDDPTSVRERHVDRLANVPLSDEEVDRIRDVCVEAHRTLIHAEEQGAEARARFERVATGGPRAEIPRDQRAGIEAALAESDRSLEIAREMLPRCMDAARRIEMRFRPQRASR